jgi:hypothetical protein
MNDDGPGRVDAKYVLWALAVLFVVVMGVVAFISRDADRRAEKAREKEERLGRKIGPEDSPPKKPGLFSKKQQTP